MDNLIVRVGRLDGKAKYIIPTNFAHFNKMRESEYYPVAN